MSQPEPDHHAAPPTVTVVVCTHQRADRLAVALPTLTALELDDGQTYEVLVVDNASTDDTPAVVERVAETTSVTVRRVFEPRKGIVPARNRGVAEARGEWIAYFDDDQLADPRWLAELLSLAREKDVRCVGGRVTLKLPDGFGRPLSPEVRMLLGESVGMDARQRYTRRLTPGCGNLMVHRSVFEEVGTFDEAYASRGEDTDLFLRMDDAGINAWYTPAAVVQHVIPRERLEESFLLRLSKVMAEGMAEDERATWGPALYPLVWLARVAQAGLVLWPRWLWARLIRDHDRAFGMRCRMSIAADYLRDGWRLLAGLPTTR